MSKNQKFEVKIYELLGIKLFKKAVFKLEKISEVNNHVNTTGEYFFTGTQQNYYISYYITK